MNPEHTSPLRWIARSHVRSRYPDTEAQLRHRNGASGLTEVWLESSEPAAIRDLLARFNGLEIDKTDGFLLLFDRPVDAVHYRFLDEEGKEAKVNIPAGLGVHA